MAEQNQRMISRIDNDPSLSDEQKYRLKTQWGWKRPEGSVSPTPQKSWIEDPLGKAADWIEETTNSSGPLTEAIRFGGKTTDLNPGNKATSIIAPLVDSDIIKTMKRLSSQIPSNVKDRSHARVASKLHRILQAHKAPVSTKEREEIIKVATSDPLANVFVQDDIDVLPVDKDIAGEYFPIFTNPTSLDAETTMYSAAANGSRGADLIRDLMRDARRSRGNGQALAIRLNQKQLPVDAQGIFKRTIPHEATHASQDRMGMFATPLGERVKTPYSLHPHEWEANYAGYYGDPAQSGLSPAELLATGARAMHKFGGHDVPDALVAEQERLQMLSRVNQMLRKNDPKSKVIIQDPDDMGLWKTWARWGPEQAAYEPLRALLTAVLGK